MTRTVRYRPTGWSSVPTTESLVGQAGGSSHDSALARPRVRIMGESRGESRDSGIVIPTSVGVPSAPHYGDHVSDTLIWADSFDGTGYTGWYKNMGSRIATGGVDGGPFTRCGIQTPADNQYMYRVFGGNPQHLFFQFWSRVSVANPGEWKMLIIHHWAESSSVTRYQFDSTSVSYGDGPSWSNSDNTTPFIRSRLSSRWEWDTALPGPSYDTQADETQPIFVWDNGGPTPHKEPAPVWSGDHDIGIVPWSPLDDGQWHELTYEIKVGDDGYVRGWIDGHLWLDSSDGPMKYPGVPDYAQFDGNAPTLGHKAFNWDLDKVVAWKRA